jgi:hypothetical protein
MIKRFAYIVLLLLFASRLSSASTIASRRYSLIFQNHSELPHTAYNTVPMDTLTTKKSKQQQEEEKKKIKEISKAKRQVKPEKIDDDVQAASKVKPKRERRPEGMERPPEIPRRNGN